MKERKGLLAAVIASLLLVPGGCNLMTTSVHDRVSLFINQLNSTDRSTINSHFDQSLTRDLPLMDGAWWNANFPLPPDSAHAYSITLLDESDPANVPAAITGPPAFNLYTGLPRNAVLVMSREGSDMFIRELFLDLSSTPLIQ